MLVTATWANRGRRRRRAGRRQARRACLSPPRGRTSGHPRDARRRGSRCCRRPRRPRLTCDGSGSGRPGSSRRSPRRRPVGDREHGHLVGDRVALGLASGSGDSSSVSLAEHQGHGATLRPSRRALDVGARSAHGQHAARRASTTRRRSRRPPGAPDRRSGRARPVRRPTSRTPAVPPVRGRSRSGSSRGGTRATDRGPTARAPATAPPASRYAVSTPAAVSAELPARHRHRGLREIVRGEARQHDVPVAQLRPVGRDEQVLLVDVAVAQHLGGRVPRLEQRRRPSGEPLRRGELLGPRCAGLARSRDEVGPDVRGRAADPTDIQVRCHRAQRQGMHRRQSATDPVREVAHRPARGARVRTRPTGAGAPAPRRNRPSARRTPTPRPSRDSAPARASPLPRRARRARAASPRRATRASAARPRRCAAPSRRSRRARSASRHTRFDQPPGTSAYAVTSPGSPNAASTAAGSGASARTASGRGTSTSMPHRWRRSPPRVHAGAMAGTEPENKYAVTLDDLEAAVRVPLEDQASEQPSDPPDLTDAEQLDERRQPASPAAPDQQRRCPALCRFPEARRGGKRQSAGHERGCDRATPRRRGARGGARGRDRRRPGRGWPS